MSRKDRFHDLVKQALIQLGWLITDDPLYLSFGATTIRIDLAAQPIIAATKNGQKIAVEVKSFIRVSQITDFYAAFGQYFTYKTALEIQHPDRQLYLAVPKTTHDILFQEFLIKKVLERYPIRLVIYNARTQEIEQWID
jgi:hypothetical protein